MRGRIDWKYLSGLGLSDPGFHHPVLSEFRTRLIAGEAESQLLETLLTIARDHGLLKAVGRQRTDSTHVLAAVRVLNRLERAGETLRAVLNSLAVVCPEPDLDPDSTPGPTTDELIALARTHREGQAYPTPEELLQNLPRMLRAISDFVLSGEADTIHTAYAIASLVEVIEHVRETPPNETPPNETLPGCAH